MGSLYYDWERYKHTYTHILTEEPFRQNFNLLTLSLLIF